LVPSFARAWTMPSASARTCRSSRPCR
jgi:hypothetical protein